jgi:hypothetical protein
MKKPTIETSFAKRSPAYPPQDHLPSCALAHRNVEEALWSHPNQTQVTRPYGVACVVARIPLYCLIFHRLCGVFCASFAHHRPSFDVHLFQEKAHAKALAGSDQTAPSSHATGLDLGTQAHLHDIVIRTAGLTIVRVVLLLWGRASVRVSMIQVFVRWWINIA